MFSGYIRLRHRERFPKLEELPRFLTNSCQQISEPYVGQIHMDKDYGKLKSSSDHLNDHVLHVRYQMPENVKDIKFTIGITDFCNMKSRRVAGKWYVIEDAILVPNGSGAGGWH